MKDSWRDRSLGFIATVCVGVWENDGMELQGFSGRCACEASWLGWIVGVVCVGEENI